MTLMEFSAEEGCMKERLLQTIRQRCVGRKMQWTNHILLRIMQRGISLADVSHVLQTGEIIEMYPTDYPYPSCLVLGYMENHACIHVVCGVGPRDLHLVTAYRPDPERWDDDGKTRKEISS